jgi:hypothetical protein
MSDHAAVPAHERLWRDRERRPAVAPKRAAERCKQCSVARLIARAACLSAKDAELVAQNKDLEFAAIVRAGEQHQQLEHTTKPEVDQRVHRHLPSAAKGGHGSRRKAGPGLLPVWSVAGERCHAPGGGNCS